MAIDFTNIAKEFGTPVYVYDAAALQERIELLRTTLPKQLKIYYAAKANPNLEILQLLRPLIDGLDISSGGEMKQAIIAGYHPDHMSFAGPGKSPAEMRYSISHNCGSLSVESIDDLKHIIETAKQFGHPANISIRLNPLKLIHAFAIKMGGKATQFGIDEEAIEPIAQLIKEHDTLLNFVGYHIYAGTQCLDAQSLNENFSNIFELLNNVIARTGLTPTKINLGGGFGVPYFNGNPTLDIAPIGKHLAALFTEFSKTYPNTEYVIELGRYIIAEAGYYVTKVLASKESRDKNYLIVDGGMHQNLSASGHLGQIIKKNYVITSSSSKVAQKNYDIAGSLCTPLDVLATNIALPETNVGDLIVIANSGAYGYTSSPLLFLGHPTPREILINHGPHKIIRETRDMTDFN